jgi:hypothetical protein
MASPGDDSLRSQAETQPDDCLALDSAHASQALDPSDDAAPAAGAFVDPAPTRPPPSARVNGADSDSTDAAISNSCSRDTTPRPNESVPSKRPNERAHDSSKRRYVRSGMYRKLEGNPPPPSPLTR